MATRDNRPVSMNDVAQAAGVSLKTVSRVVNEPEAVRESTRKAVEQAMAELGFRTNFAARSLKLGRYKTIGLVMFALTGGNRDVLDGITTAAAEEGYAITLIKKRDDEELTLSEASRRLSLLPVDGMIFNLGRMVSDFETYRAPSDLKTVIITPLEQANCSTVSDDQRGAGRMAAQHLIERGHTQIRFISGPDESLSSVCRKAGWKSALLAAGIDPAGPLPGDWTADSGYEAGLKIARDAECTAIVAANDNMAYGAICALRDAGRRVPEDVSVVGFDDSLGLSVPHAQLTSVRFRHTELGIRAFNEVVNGLNAPESRTRILVSGELIERASVRDLR